MMIRHCLVLAVSASLALAPQVRAEETDVSARSKALEVAGAFSNDGYKIRDGYWAGEIEPGKPQYLAVNLFSGNEYWFSAAATTPAKTLAIAVFDEAGKPVEFQTYENGAQTAAGVVPTESGKYIVRLSLTDGGKSPFCLLYSYK